MTGRFDAALKSRAFLISFNGIVCALLLAPPIYVLNRSPGGIIVGAAIGMLIGYAAYTNRLRPELSGVAFGVLTALNVGFAVHYTGMSNYATLAYGVHWLIAVVVLFACLGVAAGRALRPVDGTTSAQWYWPLAALTIALAAFAWHPLRDLLQRMDPFEGRHNFWYFESELVISCVALILLMWAFYRLTSVDLASRESRFNTLLRWAVYLFWPSTVAFTFAQMWLLNHAGGRNATPDIYAVAYFLFGLNALTYLGNIWTSLRMLPEDVPARELKFCFLVLVVTPCQIGLIPLSFIGVAARH